MVPMADNFNHNASLKVNSQLICLPAHFEGMREPEKVKEYSKIANYLVDYQEVFRANGYSETTITNNSHNSREIYQISNKALSI